MKSLLLEVSEIINVLHLKKGGHGGLLVGELDPRSRDPGSSPGWGHCIAFLGKTLDTHSASLHPGV